jgi:hypothetical protein
MKNRLQIMLICIISLISFSTQADGLRLGQEKKFAIGLGNYAHDVSYDNSLVGDDEFFGYAISLTYSFTDNVAVKGALYRTEHDDNSSVEAGGLDLAVVGGIGLATQGFKIYGGGGFFNETIDFQAISDEKFSGIQLVGGLGYNWEVIAIDLSVAIRNADDYADFAERYGVTGDVSATAFAFTVSARF